MNGGNENIDKLFKDAFSGGQFPMDEAMWSEANAMIKASKPTPNYFGIVGAVVTAVAVIGVSIYLFTGKNLNAKNHTYAQRDSSTDAGYLHIYNTNESENLEFQNPKTYSANSFTKTNSSTGNKHATTSANARVSANANEVTRNAQRSNTVSKNNTQSSNTANMASLVGANSGLKNSNTTITSNTENAVNPAKTNSTKTGSFTGLTKNNQVSQEDAKRSTPALFNDNNFSFHTPNEDITPLASHSTVKLMSGPLSESPSKKNSTDKIKFTPITWRLSAGYGFGSLLNSRELNSNATYQTNQLNIDLSAEYMFNPNWGIQSGITYTQTNETQRYKGVSVEDKSFMDYQDNSYWNYFDNEVTIVDQTWWLGGWWVYGTYQDTILDSNYVTQIDSSLTVVLDSTLTDFSENQKISQIEIPVLLTYNFVVNRWTFQVATGASFGLFLNSRGRVIRFNNDEIGGIETNKGLFNSMQYNYLLSTEAGFGLNEHWRITARPQLKINLNSMFNSSNSYSQKYLFYGLNVGVAFNF